MTAATNCPNCGEVLPPNAPAGHCPGCLLRIGLAVADGGLGFALEESHDRDSASLGFPSPNERVRYIGDYELLEEIAHGGMGIVYRARQVSLNRIVALKMIRAGELANEKEVARFQGEAEAAANLDHANIVPIYEVGQHEGRHYFSMKLIEGGSLAAIFSQGRSCKQEDSARLLAAAARAVHYAHQRGLLHRDLKPGNILIDRDGQPHITDFGLARRIDTDSAMTQSGAIVGTPSYVAPEQAAGAKKLTTAADVYSLGAILYELLTGQPPFRGATVMETLQKVMNEEPAPPAATREVDRDLETICLKCLEKDPAHRYGSAETLAEDLERWLAHKPIRARPITPAERVRKWVRRRPAVAALVALLFVTGLSGLGGIIWQWRAAVAAGEVARKANLEKQEQVERLWQSQFISARHYRMSGTVGQRTNALAVIAAATAIRPSFELRNEAIAALLLPDVGRRLSWKEETEHLAPFCYDADLQYYVLHSELGEAVVYRASDHAIVRKLGRGRGQTWMAAFSPDGRLVAVTFGGGELKVWRWREGVLVASVTNAHPHFGVRSFDFTPDSRELVYAQDAGGSIGRLDLISGRSLAPALTNTSVGALRLSPSGQRVAFSSKGDVQVWELNPPRQIVRVQAPPSLLFFFQLAWHPNEEVVALGGDGGLYLLDLNNLDLRFLSQTTSLIITRTFFNATGDLLFAGGWNDFCGVWDVATRQLLFEGKRNVSAPVALSRDSSRIAFNQEKVGFGVWEFLPPTALRKLFLSPDSWFELDIHPTGRWLAMGHTKGWSVWDVEAARVVLRGAEPFVHSVKFAPNGAGLYTCGTSGLQRQALRETGAGLEPGETETLRQVLPTNRPGDPSVAIDRGCFTPDARQVALLGGGRAALFDLEKNVISASIQIRRPSDNIFEISPDGHWLTANHNNQPGPDIYNLRSGVLARTLDEVGRAAVRWQPWTAELISITPSEMAFWSTDTWKPVRRIRWPAARVGSDLRAVAPDRRTVWLQTVTGPVSLFDLPTQTFRAVIEQPSSLGGQTICFDPERQRVFLSIQGGVAVLDMAELRRELAHLGLDWPDDRPSQSFSPRRP